MTILLFVLFIALCALGLASLMTRRTLKVQLEKYHPEKFSELNLDVPATHRGLNDSVSMAAYVLRKTEWPEFDVQTLSQLHERARSIEVCYYSVFLALLLGTLWFFLVS